MITNFNSEYCKVDYIQNENVVVLCWKTPAYLQNYREPTLFALELLKSFPLSNFIIDARNGFEDKKEDVEWAFSNLLPQMAKTDCTKIAFIMNQVNDIEGEMNMWSQEFGKYFAVFRATTYQEVLYKMSHMLWVDVIYKIKENKVLEFIEKLEEQGIIEDTKRECGNYLYEFSIPIKSPGEVWLKEIWADETFQQKHLLTRHYQKLAALKTEYVDSFNVQKFLITAK